MDAAHTAEQPAADGTVGVMVQGFTGVSIGVNARPRFPDGGSALFDLIEPAGGGILQQQFVGRVGVSVLRKHFAQERRGQKAGIQMTAVVQHHLVQRIRSGLALSFIQQTERNGTDIFTLAVRSNFPVIGKGGAIGKAGFFRCVTVLRCVLCLAQRLCNFCQKPPGISQIRRTHAFARVHHGLHGGNARLTPLAVVQTVQHRVLGVCPGLLFLGGLLCTAQQERIPLLHHLVVVCQDLAVAGTLIKSVGHQNGGIAPARRHAEHGGHITGAAGGRSNVCHASIRVLVQAAFCQPFFHHRVAIHQGQTGFNEHPHVARPAGTLTGRTVGGDITEVALLAPHTVLHQLTHIRIAAPKAAGHRHLRIDGMGGKLCAGQVDVRFYFCVPKAHDGKTWLIVVFALIADQFQQLCRAALFVAVPVLKVLLCEVAVLVQRFAAEQTDLLAFVGSQLHFYIACHILAKVQHRFAVGGVQQFSRKGFLLPDGHGVHTGDGQGVRLGLYAMPAGKLPFQPGIVHFALLQIVLPDGAALGCFHGIIRNTDRRSIHFQLEQDSHFFPEQVTVSIHAGGTAVPAVAQCDEQLIFTATDKCGHIVGLCPKVLVCGKAAGGKHHVADTLAVQPCRIQPLGGNVQPLALPRRGGERFAQIACRAVGLIRLRLPFAGGFQRRLLLLPVRLCKCIDGIGAVDVRLFCLRADPHALPVCLCKPGLEGSGAPCTGLVIFIPQPDAPPSLRLGRHRGGRFGVHHTAQSLSARPQRFGSGSHFNFVSSLAHAFGALPR